MTMRSRQILVAMGIVILAIWLVGTWAGSTNPAPTPSIGPSPTGAIGSGAFTFEPSDSLAPTSTTEP
jgi:hypothetical protein